MKDSNQLFFHKSVLVEEVLTYLAVKPNGVYVDATFGSGGHTRAILSQDPTCKVIALDWDSQSMDTYAPILKEEFGARFIPIWGNFAHLYKLIKKAGVSKVDGVLADFGTSQMQILERPGFSFNQDTPLDMRMSPAHQTVTAAHILSVASEQELADIFWEFGEERASRKIARAIVHDRQITAFKTTKQLSELMERLTPKHLRTKIHPATRVFQALRIYVNKELDQIHAFLASAMGIVSPEARVVCISFHSLEDRIVKHFFRELSEKGTVELLTKRAVVAGEQELSQNPSSRSAKLRAIAKI
jgi:S-adenosyl-methyltransferase MraW